MEHNEIIHLSDRESLSPHRQAGKRDRAQRNTPIGTNRPTSRRNPLKLASLNYDQVIDLNSSSDKEIETANNTRSNARRQNHASRSTRRKQKRQDDNDIEVINLASDTSPSTTPKQPANTPGKRRKQQSQFDDGEILLHSPPKAAAAAPVYSLVEKSDVERIREVFPTLSRSKVRSLLAMAESYAKENDAVHILMTLLPDDPSGESITEKNLAAAAVGGRIDCNTEDTGHQKVAQLECNCCYVEYDFEDMVSCKEGHLFCAGCLQRHTETRVFGLGNFGVDVSGKEKKGKRALEILCMHPDGCSAGFREGHLRRALSDKVMKKYDELQYQAVIEGFSDTSKCPKCDYIAFVEESVSTFHCPKCNFKSCRECGEEAHPGIRCDEVETKHETSGRNKVEEAMSNAVIRKCPRPMCRKPFMKTDGCNKITCSCGAFICYICRKEIPKHIAYKHFCQTPHCNHKSCNKCGLYTDAASADQEAMKKAAKVAAKSVSTGRKGVTVDVDSLMKKPQSDARARSNHQRHQQHRHPRDRNWRPHPYPPQPNPYHPFPHQHFQPPPQQHRMPAPPPMFAQPPPPMYPGQHQRRFGPNDGWGRGPQHRDFRR